MRNHTRRSMVAGSVSLVLVAGALMAATAAGAARSAPDDTLGRKLATEVTLPNVEAHLRKFQEIATANGGRRSAGTPGYAASVAYVVDTLRAAGLTVSTQEFPFNYFEVRKPAVLHRLVPQPRRFTPGTEVETMTYSAGGRVYGLMQPVDVQVPAGATPNSSTSGCEAGDFASFRRGHIAVLQRGTCTLAVKAQNAVAAGARAIVVFNEGQAGRTEPFVGSLGAPVSVPVVSVSYPAGADLVQTYRSRGLSLLKVETSVVNEQRTTTNVLAETAGGDARNVVMAGAHLDSVPVGPGINDNGSGSAALLETAVRIADEPVVNKVRFGFWAAEELGLLGSEHYVTSLGAGTADIRAYLNFDMIASPNWSRMVYDGDDSDGGPGGPGAEGSAQIEALFVGYFAEAGLPTVGRDIPNSSDYAAFTEVGIPIGGVHTGTDVIKTPEQAALFGGAANAPMDPCYHKACDTIANYSPVILDQNSDAIAYAIGRYAVDVSDLPAAPGASSATVTQAEPHDDES